MGNEGLAVELAKTLVLAMRWANHQVNTELDIEAFLFDGDDMSGQKRKIRSLPQGSIILDTNIEIPDESIWHQEKRVIKYDPRRTTELSFDIEEGESVVFVSRYEIDNPEQIFTSTQWRTFLTQLSSIRPVSLVSWRSVRNLRQAATSHLALLHSRKSAWS